MWSTLTVSDQEAAAQVLGDTLLAAGTPLEFRGLRALTPFVPDATMDRPGERRVATFFDTRHQLDWVLVPGGTLGAWGDRELRLLRAAFEAMEAFRAEQGEVLDARSIRPYDAPTFTFESMFRPAVTLAPFLTTAMPLTGAVKVPGLDPDRSRLLSLSAEPRVFSLHDDELPGILEPRGWRLPSARESEWMCGVGGSIFPWGDALPRWMYATEEEDLDEEWVDDGVVLDGPPEGSFEFNFRHRYDSAAADWSYANGFGLIDSLVASHWVFDGGLAWHGGTGECYPWQACGEWAGFITAAIVPEPSKPKAWSSHALRPIISLP
ncbi:MAG: hypothetical protein Q8L14_40245 [Myxococcales bacterium]|nr:hypothetical protein [Myxococcales bacterium]